MPLTMEVEFRQAAASGKLEKIIYLILKYPYLNINAIGPKSGRTALHWAAVRGQTKVIKFLKNLGADFSCADFAGFTAQELSVNPITFTKPPSKDFLEERYSQLNNIKKDFRAYGCSLIYVRNISEFENYIDKSHLNKICFILDCPNIFKAESNNIHVLPIFFERPADREIFIILDSAYVHFVPLKNKKRCERTIIFNPFIRQTTDKGCFRKAILVLMHCFLDKNLINFCLSNSISVSISEAPSNAELVLWKNNSAKKINEMIINAKILSRLNFEKMQRMGFKASSLVNNVRCLTMIPEWMFLYIEHFSLMRDLKNTEEGAFFLREIAVNENIGLNSRYKEVSRDSLIKSFNSFDKRFDFNTYRHKELASEPITNQDLKRILMLSEKLNRVNKGHNLLSNTKCTLFKPDKILSNEEKVTPKTNASNLLKF